MENTVTPSTEETKEQTAPTLEKIAELNRLDKEFLDYTKGNLSVNPEASFKWLDDWSERRFGIRGEKGSAWLESRKEYPNPNAYADALTGLVTRGYEAIATPEYNAYISAEKSGNREEMIKAAGISLTKRSEYYSADGMPIGSQDISKTDEEIDNELKEYGRKIKLQNFSAHFLTFADDFTQDEKEIVYASLRYGDGLPAEKEADYLAVWRDNPEKAARLHYLVELSRKNESAWMRDNLVHPFVTGAKNIYYGLADEAYDITEFQTLIGNMKEVVSRDGERRMWNEAERETYRKLVETESKNPFAGRIERMGLGPREIVDGMCARRMAREALPREEQLKRRKEELMLRLATSHKPYDNYDPVSNAVSGAIGTLPYMAAVAARYVGPAIGVLSQFSNVRNDIILNGGNPDDAVGAQLLSAGLYMAIEKQQFLTLTKPLTGLQKKAILERIAQTAWKNGKLGALGSAIRQGAPEFVAKTFAECVEEGLQGAIEGGTKQWWMPEEKGGGDWTKTISAALTQGGKDFVDSIGTMGLLSLVGGGLNQTQARRNALSVESLVDYAGKKMQVMNIMTGRVKEMADNKDAPANAQKMLNEITQIWQAHNGNAVAALDEMREKYSLTDDQARTVGDYLDLQTTLLNLAKTAETDEKAAEIAAFAGGAYRVGQTTGMGDTAYDVTDLFRMISPNITVEDIEVDDKTKAPVASPAVENLRQERDAALKRIEESKVGSQRKAAERELRRINKRLKAAEAKGNAVSYPKMTMRRVTIPVGKNGETRSFVIREDNEAPDIHPAGYAISVSDAVKGAEDTKDGKKVSIEEFKALPLEQKLGIAVTQEQYMAMSDDERAQYVSHFGLGGSGSFSLLDENNREIFNSDAMVKLFRGKVGTPGARIGGNWSLAHEYTHGVVRFLRDIDAIDEGTVALMRRLFGEPTNSNELWNEEAMANGFAEFLRGEFDFRRLTPEERREAMGFFERVWDIIKDFFRRIFGKEIDEPPVVANIRKEAERAVFNALRNGDLSGLDQYAGIEFEEENREEGRGNREEQTQDAQKQPSKPSEEKTTNEPPKSKEHVPTASTPSNTAKDAPKESAKAETTPTAAPAATIDVAAIVEQVENPIATAANLPARTNTKMTIFTPGYEMKIECEKMWVPLNELAESTDDREVQMRDRSRRATDEQVRTKTRKGVFQPLALFPGKKSDDGAPIVGGGMKIISGHGRKRMLEQLAAEGRFGEYLSAINAEAQRQSVPTAPEGMKNPVLVLRVTGGLDKKSDLNRFAELSNRWGGLERSGAELAESDARKITDALLRLYNPDASGNLLAASNRDFMAAFLKEVGATGLTNADGTPTPEAALRVQRALMTAIFGNDEKIRAIIQNLLEKSGELSLGNLTNALMRSAGKLLAMKRAKGSFDIVNDVREAAYHYIAWRSAQQKQKSLSFADYLNEQDMFTAGATPMQAALAKLLEVGRFGTVLDEYSKLVAQEAVDAQGTFDFAEKRTPLQLLGYAERNTLAAEETPVTPDPTSAEAAAPVQTPPAVSEAESGVSADPSVLTPNPSLSTAQAVITPPEPETFTPAPLVRGTATLPGPGAEGIKAHQVNANGEATTRAKTLPAGAWNLLRAPYDVRRPPKASAQDKAGRGLKISNPPPVDWNGIFPHFQGNKTEMADRTSQAIRANMTKAEREHYTTVVDYFGGGGCWGLFHALANFPNAKTLVVNEFDPDRLGKIRLLHEIDGEVAEIAYKLLDERYEEIREAAKDSSSPSTVAKVVESQFKRLYTDPTERAAIQAFIDCAHTLLATSKDAQGNAINDTRLGIRRAIDTLREDGRKAKEAADAFKAREGATIRYVSGDAVANADTLPHGDDVMAIADPPYYLTADYQQNTILGLEKVPDNWSYRATQEFLHKLVDSGDGLVYTDEAWWFKEAYSPDQQEDFFTGGSTFAKEQEILLDIINTLDHFDVAGRVVGRQEVLGVHHGHKINARTENGENGNAVRPDTIDNAGGGRGAGQALLGVAAEPQGQGGRDGTDSGARGLNGERASVIASGRRALAREVIIQDIAASLESAATEIAQGATVDTDAVSRLARYSVRQVREERMAEYAQFVRTNAKAWLKHAAKRLDERMKEAGYTEKVWHGTYGEDFNVFKFSANSHDVPAAYFTYSHGAAQNYAALTGEFDSWDANSLFQWDKAEDRLFNTRQFYVNPGKVLEIDERSNPSSFEDFKKMLAKAYANGYNAVRVKGALNDQGARLDEFDNGPVTFLEEDEMPGDGEGNFEADILIVMQQPGDNAQARIKAADTVTFDDDELPIPLEMRVDQSMNDLRYSVQMGKKAREEARRMIEKYRPGLHGLLTNFNGVLMPQDDAAINSIAAFETPKERKAALLWFCKDAIRLPEDAPKVTEAIKTAERAKVDPMQYERPGDILEKFSEFRPKEPPINPDTVPELSDKREMGSGVTTYLVQDDKAGQLAMRKIINTHWGKDANPWCLLQGDGYGNLSDGSNGRYDAWHYWQHYNALPKLVAFQDGKLLAFMATDGHAGGIMADEDVKEQWWDRADKSHDGIPMKRVTKGESEYGASTTTEIIELMQDGTEVSTGKKRESIAPDGTRTEEIWGDGGNADRYDCNIHYPSGVREEKTIGRNITKTTFSTATDNLLEATSMQYSNSLAEEITWRHDNYTDYRLITKNSAYVLYKYERGAYREMDVEYTSEIVNAWRDSAEAALRRGEAMPALPRAESASTTPRWSVSITRPWRKGFPNATVMTTRKAILEKHGDLFTKAKAGDVEAAADLIDALMSDKKRIAKVQELKRRHPKAAFVAAVHAEEATGRNKIPYSFAKFIAKTLGIKTTDSIVQTVRAEHSGADAWHRLTHRAQFTGVVESGKEYILVDDHITQGGTLNELRSYIENEGGKVVDIIALTSSKGSTILVPKKETIDELKTRYPDINRLLREADIAGRVEALTNSEAEYIKTFSPDTFRNRIAQAGSERGRRLFGEALGEPPSDSVARTEWSETPEERETMRNSVFMGARGAVRTDKLNSLVAAVERFKEKYSERYTDKARDDIYINTGWWQGTDGQWRVEIPDMRIKTVEYLEPSTYNGEDAELKLLGDLVSNTRLFKAYPDLKRLPIVFLPDESDQIKGARGVYNGYEILLPYDALTTLDPDDGEIRLTREYLRTLTHEVQHAIQHIEGFAPGGNRKDHGSRNYVRLAGEVEARNAAFRQGYLYNQLNRATAKPNDRAAGIAVNAAPWQTEDVPTLKQILINENNEMTDVRGNQIERHHVRRGRTPRNIDDTLTSYVAAQIMGGTDVTIEDMRKIVSSASSGTRAADILERAKTLANDNRAKAVAKAASSVAETSARLGDMLESDRLGEALSDAVTMGAKAANPETGRKLQQVIEQKRIRDLQAAEGFTAAEIMAELPIDLADGVLATAELEHTPEELARIEEAKKKREEERAKVLETEEGAEELADPETPMRDPTEAERKAVDDLLDRARMRDDLAKQEEERKRAEKAKRDAADGDGDSESDAGDDAADAIPLLPEEAVRRIAPVFESADVFSWFIIELTGDKTLEKHPELPSTGEMWKSPVAVRELKKTAADILRRLAKDTLGSPSINYARNLVDRAINELESDLETKTFNSVRHKIAHIYEMIWDNAHRITKNELMKELKKTISKLTQKGRFSYTQEEMDRNIPAKIKRWATWVLKYARMGEAKLQNEIANLEKLTSENPASEDGKMPTPVELAEAADKLAVAKVYGHLKGKSIGQMRDLIDQISAKLDGERQAFELRRAKIEEANKTIVDALVNALTQGKANRRNKAKAKGIIDRAMESMISSIDQQMVDLIRFCTDPELRKKALEAIDELTILINEGGNRYRNTLATAQDEIHDGLKACYGDAAKGIRHLHVELPPEIVEQFFRQSSDQKRTYGHLLQLYASCLQRDYAENIHKHGRDEQIAAMEAALTAQDKMFHTWAVNWYKHNRQALSDAVEEVTGLPVIAPDELYVPVRVETEPSGIPAEVVAWSPVPRALSRRVRHGLDFDENAHFLSMVNEQAEIRAQTIGYAMTGIILRDTIASRDVQTAARRNASPSDMNAVILHLRDILAQDVGKERSDGEICLKFLRKWAARFNIAWNPSSALAQPASIPVWANVLLDGEAWGAMSVLKAMASAATEEGRAAIAELRASDGYRARYKLGWSEEVANVYANPNEPKLLSKLEAAYDKGMILSQFTDACCSLLVAQGFYRHATDVFVRRGETIEEAKRKALALTWAAVEQTQQSGRTENLSAIQRGKVKNIVNAILQFKTAQVLQNSYIIRAIRDVQAGVPGAKGRLARAIFISTVWVPGYLSLKGALWALIMGVKPEPDDEDEMPLWFREMLYSAVDGVTAPLFVTSLFVEKPLREMLSLKSYPRRTGFASVDTAKRLVEDAYDLITDPIMLEEELTSEKIIDDIWKVIGDVSAPVRHVRKAINNRRED